MSDLGRLLRNRDFAFYWVGVVVSQLGTRATQAACLYHVYALSDSISITGLVGPRPRPRRDRPEARQRLRKAALALDEKGFTPPGGVARAPAIRSASIVLPQEQAMLDGVRGAATAAEGPRRASHLSMVVW